MPSPCVASARNLGQLPAEVIAGIHMLIDAQPCDFRLTVRLDPTSTLQFQSHPQGAHSTTHDTDMEEFNATLTRLPGCGYGDFESGRALRDFFNQQMTNVGQVVEKCGLTKGKAYLEALDEPDYLGIVCTQGTADMTIYGRDLGTTRIRRIRPVGCSVLLTRGQRAWLVIAEQNLQERVYFSARGARRKDPFEPLIIQKPFFQWAGYPPGSFDPTQCWP
jgi:hypothetical protein